MMYGLTNPKTNSYPCFPTTKSCLCIPHYMFCTPRPWSRRQFPTYIS